MNIRIYCLLIVFLSPTISFADTIGTPEETWQTFYNSMKSGNKKLAIEALTMQAQRTYSPVIEQLTPTQMAEFVEGVSIIFSEGKTYGENAFREFLGCAEENGTKNCSSIIFYCIDNKCKIKTM